MQAHYTAPSTPESSPADGQWKRFRDDRVMMWAERTGPSLKPRHKAVLKFLSEFADPATGEAYPSQQTIADATGYSRVAVNQALQEMGPKDPDGDTSGVGLLSWRKEPARENQPGCKIFYNIYRLAGVDSDWEVVRSPSEPGVLSPVARDLVTLFSRMQQLVDRLEECGGDASDIIANNDIQNLAARVKFSNFTRVEENDGEDEIPPDEIPDPPLESHVERVEGTLEDLIRAQEASADPVMRCDSCGHMEHCREGPDHLFRCDECRGQGGGL